MKRLRDILPLIVVLVGLAIMGYPTLSNFLVERNASRVVAGYEKAVDALSDEKAKAMMDAARAYNAKLAGLAGVPENEGGADASTVSAADLAREYDDLLNLNGDGMMGYITIPRLNETLPVYHGTEEKTLQVGIGHIETSSLPVGGASTHAAVSGHRGLPSAKLFTDLDQMKEGDVFYFKILKTTLAYQVDKIEVVLPDQAESLDITAGDDYCTLVTCTPYGINSHRLLVRGHAIPYTPDMDEHVGKAGSPFNIPLPYLALMIALAVLAVFLASMLVGGAVERRRAAVGGAGVGAGAAGARRRGGPRGRGGAGVRRSQGNSRSEGSVGKHARK